MIIESIAPTRIDLAGGTLDIWPLYCFHPGSLTVNAAINLFSRVIIETRKDRKFFIRSADLKKTTSFNSFRELVRFGPDSALKLIAKITAFYQPEQGLNINTDCDAPPGSGLGGSSSLNIALNGALNRLTGSKYSTEQMIGIAKDIEASVIKVPTGLQDYYAAMYGGVNAIWFSTPFWTTYSTRFLGKSGACSFGIPFKRAGFTPGGVWLEKIKNGKVLMEKSLILCYSGQARHSGTNNWEVFKRHIDGDKNIYRRLEKIKQTALELRENLAGGNLKKTALTLKKEWDNRKKLFSGISNSRIDTLIKSGLKKGALAAKICGAGGGGFLIFLAEEKNKENIKRELIRRQGIPFDFKVAAQGLRVIRKG